MKRLCLLLILLGSRAAAQDYVLVSPTDTEVFIKYGAYGLQHDDSCTLTLKDAGDSTIDSDVQATGRSRRSVAFSGLSANTQYNVTVDCGVVLDWPVGEAFFTTLEAPPPGDLSVSISVGRPRTQSTAAKLTIEYDDDPAFGSSDTVTNGSCSSGCTPTITVPNELQYFRLIWKDSGDAVLWTGRPETLWGSVGRQQQVLLQSVTPPVTGVPIPELATWEANMLTYGDLHCTRWKDGTYNSRLQHYYDATKVFLQIADYTSDADWLECLDQGPEGGTIGVFHDYLQLYNYLVPAYECWGTGMRMDWETNARAQSQLDVHTQASSCTYHWLSDTSVTEDANLSRETARAITNQLDAMAIGYSTRLNHPEQAYADRVAFLAGHAKDHIDQWFVTKDFIKASNNDPPEANGRYYIQPFMVAMTVDALIRYYEYTCDTSCDTAIPPLIDTALEAIWQRAWVSTDESFWYQNWIDDPDDAFPAAPGAPDLNLLIAPGFAWMWDYSSDTKWRDRGDAIFAGGATQAWLSQSKQFNQSYMLAFDYVTLRTP